MVDKISPHDPRVQYKTADLNGINYSYILAEPSGKPINTIFLIHGWPDLSLGWRYQIPFLTSLGLRVIAPDMMGYGGTDAPSSLSFYTFKRAADDMAALAHQLGLSSIIVAGHDWGGAVVYRLAMRHPHLISALISICTPFGPPTTEYFDLTTLPNFQYQLQLRGPDVEAQIVGEAKIRQFLNALFGGQCPNGELAFSVDHGCYFEKLSKCLPSRLVSAAELDFYASRYAIHGMRGPLNWYRTGPLNFEEEKELAAELEKNEDWKFEIPVLFIAGSRDAALPPSVSEGMDIWFGDLTRAEVDTSHWALWEKPAEVNQYIKEFLTQKVGPTKANL
jgi:pimeloyl-ACP methyl ester carboxylesterase